jgi:MoaA/NifB/PqqE/SkfB family radical SAM enzyme
MTNILATATLKHLSRRCLLDNALRLKGFDLDKTKPVLKKLLLSSDGIPTQELDRDLVDNLFHHHLVQFYSFDNKPISTPFTFFRFIRFINFELTYSCQLSCSHCLQAGLRSQNKFGWLPVDAVIRAIHDAKWLGLTALVNFTGGEIFTPRSPILELLAVAKEVDILTRANTNGWWGGQSKIKVGNRVFQKDEDVVQAFVDRKLMRLALSLDNRYEQYPKLLDRVVRVASLCEAAKLPYEVVATQPSQKIIGIALKKLIVAIGSEPYYMRVSPMTTVDVGAAALQNKSGLDVSKIVELVYSAHCATKGFHRPSFLHIAPDGGVRSCMYAPGSGWLGNIIHQSLPEILNKIAERPVYQLFKSGNFDDFVDEYMAGWAHLYKDINHGCTASAVIARIAEEVYKKEAEHDRCLTEEEMTELHKTIGKDYHLLVN